MIDWSGNKETYREFCQRQVDLPVFFQDWWLDVVCEKGKWDVCLSKDNGDNIKGVLPFYRTTFFGMKVIKMPDLTPNLGIWMNYPNVGGKQKASYRFGKRVIEDLIMQLPKVMYYAQRHPIQLTNWLPFFWDGYKQTTRYTFRIEQPIDLKEAYAKFKSSTRNKISKAKKEVELIETDDIELFYKINQLTFERQGLKMPYSLAFLKKIDAALFKRKQRKILLARDVENRYHAGIYLVWDKKTVYNLLLGADTKLRNSGAVQRLLWEGIQIAAAKKRTFDFEGSMMPNIESVFRSFGGKLTPYSKIYKEDNFLIRILNSIRNS
jgi:GNAT acetyltransferase-like protein